MHYYQSKVFCIDQEKCSTSEYSCLKKMTALRKRCATSADIPVAWGIFKDTCGKYKEKK